MGMKIAAPGEGGNDAAATRDERIQRVLIWGAAKPEAPGLCGGAAAADRPTTTRGVNQGQKWTWLTATAGPV
jgi:hypothetical protein